MTEEKDAETLADEAMIKMMEASSSKAQENVSVPNESDAEAEADPEIIKMKDSAYIQ